MLHALDRRNAVAFLVAATFFMENLNATASAPPIPDFVLRSTRC
jgi:hypothetical protein